MTALAALLACRLASPALAAAARPQALDAPGLDCLFDGDCVPRASQDLPIRQEDKVLPPAPRYALDLKAVPPEFLRLIPLFEAIPHQNQEETPEWVETINSLIRAKNAGRAGSKLREWRYDGRPNEPPFSCLSYGIAAVMDWWTLQCGGELQAHRSMTHGGVEYGWDPRTLELEYFYRSSTGDPAYHLFSGQLPIERDPVRRIPVPYSPRGYAEIALESRPFANPDPYTDEVLRYDPSRNPMEGQYVQLFSNRLARSRTPDRYARVLAEAVDKWGAAYVQLEQTERPRAFGAHAVAVVGYFCMEPDGRFLRCAANPTDADWGRTAYFAVHDSFGDFPAGKVRDASGGSAYRAVRIESVDEAYVFPHSLRVSARPVAGSPGTWSVRVTNRCGRPVPVERAAVLAGPAAAASAGSDEVRVTGQPGAAAKIEIAARHYYEADGAPRVFELRLDPQAPTDGAELRRTPPTPAFYDRRGGR